MLSDITLSLRKYTSHKPSTVRARGVVSDRFLRVGPRGSRIFTLKRMYRVYQGAGWTAENRYSVTLDVACG